MANELRHATLWFPLGRHGGAPVWTSELGTAPRNTHGQDERAERSGGPTGGVGDRLGERARASEGGPGGQGE